MLFILFIPLILTHTAASLFDTDLYESVLDPELCDHQISYLLRNDTGLLLEFLDTGIRIPTGVMTGNLLHLGNYYQCLNIEQEIPNTQIEGKYCMLNVPLEQNLEFPSLPSLPEWPDIPWPEIPWPEFPWPGLNPNTTILKPDIQRRLKENNILKSRLQTLIGVKSREKTVTGTPFGGLSLNLAICVPKACDAKEILSSMRGLEYTENFCRLPNDKPWVPGDYVALTIFALIILLTVLSTTYDIHYQKYSERDPKKINKLYQSFSIYTNTRRLVTYTPVPGALECLDGIRSLAMTWVILGHTFSTQLTHTLLSNPLDGFSWMMGLSAIWMTSAPITVDTFFMLGGLLLVYISAGKFTGIKLLKSLHLFYLNRLLRVFPLLAAVILLQISFFHWATDGPYWGEIVGPAVQDCRDNWWATLLHVQNFLHPEDMCIGHSWYIAIDVQLYILSPLVLYWVLGERRSSAWTALIGALIAVLAGATTFNFIYEFQPAPVSPSRPDGAVRYMKLYYFNTLTRAAPFFVGMIVGYLLHVYRKQKAVINIYISSLLWTCATVVVGLIMYSSYPTLQLDWDNQIADSMINSFMRAAWAMAVGWLIFACVQGYGGVINWILSLQMWKVISRISYAMYLVHYPMMFMVNAMAVTPLYFTVPVMIFKFLADFSLAALVGFLLTILIEAPCGTLIKHYLGGQKKTSPKEPAVEERPKI